MMVEVTDAEIHHHDTETQSEEPKLTPNAMAVLAKRYLLRNAEGQPIETPRELFRRVARSVAQATSNYPNRTLTEETAAENYYRLMASGDFLPNSPTLMNAGKPRPQQLSACFVLPVGDDINSIFDAVKHAAVIHKTGGGTGFCFSRLRPKNDLVRSTHGVSSGPVSFMRVFNAATEAIKQGGARRGANMGILRVDHPDILEFINCKSDMTSITNFNISVALTEEFMQAAEQDKHYGLRNPRSGQVTKVLRAREVFDMLVDNAWKNGDPGVVFIDRINQDNPTPAIGSIDSTNPCGEQPLMAYEACNLGSINLAHMLCAEHGSAIKQFDGYTSRNLLNEGWCWAIDWRRLHDTIHWAVRFLDDVVDQCDFPLPEIEERVKRGNRKIGLGVMGFADMLFKLGISYAGREAVELGERLMQFIQQQAVKASCALAVERSAFGNFGRSVFAGGPPRRNATVTTIAPTGTISMIAGCSSGIEPLFALCFHRKILDNQVFHELHPYFEQVAKARGFYSQRLMDELQKHGTCKALEEVPEDVREVFTIAHDVSPEWHLEHQAAFQRHCENAVSKTVNFPHGATREDVANVYSQAWKKGCKGVTIYRDGSRDVQVLNLGDGSQRQQQPAAAAVSPPPSVSRHPLTITAGGMKMRLHTPKTQAKPGETLERRFTAAPPDTNTVQRLAGLDTLFLSDGNGFKVPLRQTAREGAFGGRLRVVIDLPDEQQPFDGPLCPECGGQLHMAEGCCSCPCGYSKCG